MRNIIAGLLAVYMLALVFMPCNDSCDAKQHSTIITIQAAQEHHDQANDFCSPLCSCSCCSLLVTTVHSFRLKTTFQIKAKTYALLNHSIYSIFLNNCWQPPRLV